LREVIFSHAFTAKVKKSMKNRAAPESTGGEAGSYVSKRVERKALWEPRRVEGDGHVMATCGFTRPRSFTEDNAFHQRSPKATGAAAELAEALVAG